MRLTGVPGPRTTSVSEEWNEDHGLLVADGTSDDSIGRGELTWGLDATAVFPSGSDTLLSSIASPRHVCGHVHVA